MPMYSDVLTLKLGTKMMETLTLLIWPIVMRILFSDASNSQTNNLINSTVEHSISTNVIQYSNLTTHNQNGINGRVNSFLSDKGSILSFVLS